MKSIVRFGLTAALVAGGWVATASASSAVTASTCTPSWGQFTGVYQQVPGINTNSGQPIVGSPDKSLSVAQSGITPCPGDTFTLNVFDWTTNAAGVPGPIRQLASVIVPLQTSSDGTNYVGYSWHLPDTATWGTSVCVSGTINQPDGSTVNGPANAPCTEVDLNGGGSGGISWH